MNHTQLCRALLIVSRITSQGIGCPYSDVWSLTTVIIVNQLWLRTASDQTNTAMATTFLSGRSLKYGATLFVSGSSSLFLVSSIGRRNRHGILSDLHSRYVCWKDLFFQRFQIHNPFITGLLGHAKPKSSRSHRKKSCRSRSLWKTVLLGVGHVNPPSYYIKSRANPQGWASPARPFFNQLSTLRRRWS
jgi:hypothetical protein